MTMNEFSIKKPLSILAGLSSHVISGSVLSFLSLRPYRYSYLLRNDPKTTPTSLDLILPIAFGLMYACFWLGAFIEKKTSPRIAVLIGDVIIILGIALMSFSHSVLFDYFIYAAYGIGIGISVSIHLASIKCVLCAFNSYPINGLVIGISMFGFAFSSAFALMVNLMINPDNIKATINYNGSGQYIFPLYISERIHRFNLIYLAAIAGLSALNVLCSCSYNKDDLNQKQTVHHQYLNEEVNASNAFEGSDQAICCASRPFMLLIIGIFSSFSNFFCLFCYYKYGRDYLANDMMLSYCSFGFIVCCGIGHFAWGLLYDRIRFKLSMYLISGLQCLLSIAIYFFVKLNWPYLLCVSAMGFAYGGVSVLFPLNVWGYYQSERGMLAYGFIAIGKALSALLPMSIILVLASTSISLGTTYLILAVSSAACSLLSVLVVMFGTEDNNLAYF